jgi:hypothetical protein
MDASPEAMRGMLGDAVNWGTAGWCRRSLNHVVSGRGYRHRLTALSPTAYLWTVHKGKAGSFDRADFNGKLVGFFGGICAVMLCAGESQETAMEGSSNIALGIVAGAAVLLFGFIGYHEYERQRDIREAEEMLSSLGGYATQAMADASRQEQRRRAAQAYQQSVDRQQKLQDEELRREHRTLASNQRCVAGTVITVNGSAYTQDIGVDGRPVQCSGNLAIQPLR